MKRVYAVLGLCTLAAGLNVFAADMSTKPVKLTGYIGDSKCGSSHNAAAQDSACVTKCIAEGAKPVFIDDDKKQVWAIANPDAIKDDEGKPVTIMATVDSTAMSVHIEKVSKVGKVKAPASGMKMD